MRSLILAGGGLKIAYQAGCMQVLLDEAKIAFDHVDAASGGCFNAALLANGCTGTEIAEIWREMQPKDFFSLNFGEYRKLLWGRSIGTADGLRRIIREDWKLDFDRIRACRASAFTFNVTNFSRKEVQVVKQTEMTEDYLVACTALVMWLPPVIVDGEIFFDAVYNRDANVGEAVRRGADEIYAIWTVADHPEFRDGFLAQYFHLIETAADTRFFEEWAEVKAVNAAIAVHGADMSRAATDLRLALPVDRREGEPKPPPGRKAIALHLIKQEVPVHYIFNVSRDRMRTAVAMGVRDTRRECGLPDHALYTVPTLVPRKPVGIAFTETMGGFFMPGETDPKHGAKAGKAAGHKLRFRLTVSSDDVDTYLGTPDHRASASGVVECAVLSTKPMTIAPGSSCKLFVIDQASDGTNLPRHKRFVYELFFAEHDGTRYVLEGEKHVVDASGHAPWPDTTTLFTKVFEVGADNARTSAGAGILHMTVAQFLRELTTFRVSNAESPFHALNELMRFGQFFLGQAWDVYARFILEYAAF